MIRSIRFNRLEHALLRHRKHWRRQPPAGSDFQFRFYKFVLFIGENGTGLSLVDTIRITQNVDFVCQINTSFPLNGRICDIYYTS